MVKYFDCLEGNMLRGVVLKIGIKIKNEKWVLAIIGIVLLLFFIIFSFPKTNITVNVESKLTGDGTQSCPFLVSDVEDLIWIQESVNTGNEFDGCYFSQISNIDLSEVENWVPIGNEQYSFDGIYDGNGYYIENLYINTENAALFNKINGVICNLGIESGTIIGNRSASFAICENSNDAAIINCYSKAKLQGDYVGGIANCFWRGKIVCCWTDCEIISDNQFGIVCEGADVKIYGCNTTSNMLFPTIISGSNCYSKTISQLYDAKQIKKFNHYIALSQGLFADKYAIKLKQYNQHLKFSSSRDIIVTYEFINMWMLPFLGLLLLVMILYKYFRVGNEEWSTLTFIVGIITFFTDIFGIYLGIEKINISGLVLLFELNYAFFVSLYMTMKKSGWKIGFNLHKNRYMYMVMVLVIFFELLQFCDIPHFDGTIYYASLVRSIDEFRLNFFTYLGAFVCWKEIQGLALFIAPWECLFHGEMIGLYIGNICISIITIFFFFGLFKTLYPNMADKILSLFCICFFFFPYAMGLFTYLCMDYHLPLFAIWLMYGLSKKNNKLVAFSGFLLSFTKITGFVFYVLVLFAYVSVDVICRRHMKDKVFCIVKEYKIKVIYWFIPIIEYLLMYKYSGKFSIQNFFGAYRAESPVALKSIKEIICTVHQSFVYGFRWIIILMLIIAIINICFDKREKSGLCNEGKKILISTCTGCIAVVFLLLIYNGDAMCPRYTAVLNIGYIILLPFIIYNFIGEKKIGIKIAISLLTILMVIQTYFNIDPTMLINNSIDVGGIKIYEGVPRSITTITWNGSPVLCDSYVYNYQHNLYSNLMNSVFDKINPTTKDCFYVLDTHEYELNICGSWNRNYKIFWNSKKRRFNFDEWDKYSNYLNVSRISSDEIRKGTDMGNEFFLIVPSRASEDAINYLYGQGYFVEEKYEVKNVYASLRVLLFKHGLSDDIG